MEIKLIIGGRYAVSTDSVCRVTYMRDGKEREYTTAYAGKQGYFVAQSQVAYVDDETADVTLFPDAPTAIDWLCGGGNTDGLPNGYTRVEYLEGQGKQYINTGIKLTSESHVKTKFILTSLQWCEYIFGYTGSAGDSFCLAAKYESYPRVFFGSADSVFVLPDGSLQAKIGEEYIADMSKEGLYINSERIVTNDEIPWGETFRAAKESLLFCKLGTRIDDFKTKAKIYSFTIYEGGAKILSYTPAIDPTGAACMFDYVSRKPFYNRAAGAFIAGVDTQEQLDAVLRGLPDRTGLEVGTLQVRLAEPLQTPENEAKLDAMLNKNWEITQAA